MLVSSPRTWGCFSYLHSTWRARRVFPTHVGVFLSIKSSSTSTRCLPHARGGVSKTEALSRLKELSSPRTWGCFLRRPAKPRHSCVFPTHVGVFLDGSKVTGPSWRLPHARGGVSAKWKPVYRVTLSSPRTWGCFSYSLVQHGIHVVFPTHVGVFPHQLCGLLAIPRLPHARGGVSK